MAGDSSVVLNPGAGGSSMATYQDAGGLQHQKVVLETETPSGDPAKVNASNPLPAAVAGTVASGATNAGNPVKIGAAYNTAAPTFTTGQLGDVQMDVNGNLKVNIAAGAAAGGTDTGASNLQRRPEQVIAWHHLSGTTLAGEGWRQSAFDLCPRHSTR